MRLLLFICMVLVGLPLRIVVQYQGPAVKIEPRQPQPSQTLTITYSPAGTKLANASAIDGVVYWLRPKTDPVAKSFVPVKNGATYKATVTVPDSVTSFVLVFENGKTKDNNGDKTYAFLLYGADGKPVPGSYAKLSQIYSSDYYYLGTEGKDMITARRLVDQELALYPATKRENMNALLYSFNLGQDAGRKDLKTELDAFAALPDLTKEELESLRYFYKQLTLKDQVDALAKRIDQQYHPTVDWDKAYKEFTGPSLSLAQKKVNYAKLKQEDARITDPKTFRYLPYIYSAYLGTLADSTKWSDFQTLVSEAPDSYKPSTMSAYNSIAWNWVEKGKNLEQGAKLAQEATEWAKAQITAARMATDNSWQTDQQLQKMRRRSYAVYADTYGYILVKQGKTEQALPFLKDAAQDMDYENFGINERYINALAQTDGAAVTNAAEALLTKNKSSKAIEEALKMAYVKKHGGETGFDSYLNGLKNKGLEHQKAELREKLISRPAPAFSLVNLEGKTVNLADYKGKTVIVDFWATWCGPCIASFPSMQKALEKYKNDPSVAFLFVNSWQTETDKKKNAADFIAKKGYPFNVLLDEKNQVIEAYNVTGIPTKFVIDKTGTIRLKHVGFSGDLETAVSEIGMMIALANEPVN